jgi:hypothetical protein
MRRGSRGPASEGGGGRGGFVEAFEEGWSLGEAAEAAETSERTAGKWSARYRVGGERALLDRSSAPHRVHNRTPAARVAVIKALRGLRFSGPEIAELLSMPISTVSGILKREGLGRLGRLGLEPARRYERSRPGELIHIDVKKLARIERAGHRVSGDRLRYQRVRGAGWEFVHVAVDDATRLAYAEVLADERKATATASCGVRSPSLAPLGSP